MKSIDYAKKFVFNALLIEESLFKMHDDGVSVKYGVASTPITRIVENDFSPTVWFQASQMSSVYMILYCIENTLRQLIIDRLSERKGLTWWENCVSQKIKKNAERIKKEEEVNKYISSRSTILINYTLLDDLGDIICTNWDDFSDIVPDQAWVKSRMSDLTKCRNIIMHTGVLPQNEIDRIDNIARDFIKQFN